MRSYREHLRVPASYWVLGFITMVTFASFAWAGFSVAVAIGAYVVLVIAPGVLLWIWGNATISVDDGELRAGRDALPLARAGHVQVLDEQQTGKLRGPPLRSPIEPPISSTSRREIASPIPVPSGLVLKKGSKAWAWVSESMPVPVSRTFSITYWPELICTCCEVYMSLISTFVVSKMILPPLGIASRALIARFIKTCSI